MAATAARPTEAQCRRRGWSSHVQFVVCNRTLAARASRKQEGSSRHHMMTSRRVERHLYTHTNVHTNKPTARDCQNNISQLLSSLTTTTTSAGRERRRHARCVIHVTRACVRCVRCCTSSEQSGGGGRSTRPFTVCTSYAHVASLVSSASQQPDSVIDP